MADSFDKLSGNQSQWIWSSVLATSMAGAVLLYLNHLRRQKKGRIRQPLDLKYDHQSVMVPNSSGYDIRGSPISNLGDNTSEAEFQSVYENFQRGLKVSNNGPCLGYRPPDSAQYAWITYEKILESAHRFGMWLVNLGLKQGNETRIGIYAKNCPEWVISQLGACSQNIVIVPLYDTLGPDVLSYIVNHAELKLVVCDTCRNAMKMIEKASMMPTLKHLVLIEDVVDAELLEKANDVSLEVHRFADTQKFEKNENYSMLLPKPNDIYIICYTSGTTGQPKGVTITHKNLISIASSGMKVFRKYDLEFTAGQTAISYLPLAHMFEQITQSICFHYGCKIGFFRGQVAGLLDDIKALKPDVFPVVPRLLNRLYDTIQTNLKKANPLARAMFRMAYNAKFEEMTRGIVRRDSFWDKLVFRRLQNELGGNVSLIVTGSAPVAKEVLDLCRVSMGVLILEGYGQTESTGIVTMTLPGDMSTGGHVGGPAPDIQVRLVDVPELGYFSKDGNGEICVRGQNVMSGYFKDPKKTAEILDEEGWLYTGDVGMWLPNGALRVIDRKKHIFKLAQGEYVAPEKIENVYVRAPVVAQVFVDGNSLERFLVAVVVPEEAILKSWYSQEKQIDDPSMLTMQTMCFDSKAADYVLSEMQATGSANKLNSLEQVKSVYLSAEPFSQENGLLTPTMKAKRPQLRKQFAAVIESLYKK